MQFPLVTRRHHDAEVSALNAEIDNLINRIVQLGREHRGRRDELQRKLDAAKAAINDVKADALKRVTHAEDQRDYAFRVASGREDWLDRMYAVPVYHPRINAYKLDGGCPNPWEPIKTFCLNIERIRFDFRMDVDLESMEGDGRMEVFIRHVAAQAGSDYGKAVQHATYESLKCLIPESERL